MAMRTLDRAVLVSDAAILVCRRHVVMGAERLAALCQILLRVGLEIAEGGGQAIAAMLLGRAAQRPERVLQPFRQRDEAFAAKNDMGVLEARKGEPEVIEPAVKRLPGDGDAKIAHIGEVG